MVDLRHEKRPKIISMIRRSITSGPKLFLGFHLVFRFGVMQMMMMVLIVLLWASPCATKPTIVTKEVIFLSGR